MKNIVCVLMGRKTILDDSLELLMATSLEQIDNIYDLCIQRTKEAEEINEPIDLKLYTYNDGELIEISFWNSNNDDFDKVFSPADLIEE